MDVPSLQAATAALMGAQAQATQEVTKTAAIVEADVAAAKTAQATAAAQNQAVSTESAAFATELARRNNEFLAALGGEEEKLQIAQAIKASVDKQQEALAYLNTPMSGPLAYLGAIFRAPLAQNTVDLETQNQAAYARQMATLQQTYAQMTATSRAPETLVQAENAAKLAEAAAAGAKGNLELTLTNARATGEVTNQKLRTAESGVNLSLNLAQEQRAQQDQARQNAESSLRIQGLKLDLARAQQAAEAGKLEDETITAGAKKYFGNTSPEARGAFARILNSDKNLNNALFVVESGTVDPATLAANATKDPSLRTALALTLGQGISAPTNRQIGSAIVDAASNVDPETGKAKLTGLTSKEILEGKKDGTKIVPTVTVPNRAGTAQISLLDRFTEEAEHLLANPLDPANRAKLDASPTWKATNQRLGGLPQKLIETVGVLPGGAGAEEYVAAAHSLGLNDAQTFDIITSMGAAQQQSYSLGNLVKAPLLTPFRVKDVRVGVFGEEIENGVVDVTSAEELTAFRIRRERRTALRSLLENVNANPRPSLLFN